MLQGKKCHDREVSSNKETRRQNLRNAALLEHIRTSAFSSSCSLWDQRQKRKGNSSVPTSDVVVVVITLNNVILQLITKKCYEIISKCDLYFVTQSCVHWCIVMCALWVCVSCPGAYERILCPLSLLNDVTVNRCNDLTDPSNLW